MKSQTVICVTACHCDSKHYNGKEELYHNEAISTGELDFSDLSEVCWIMGLKDIKDTEHFINLYSSKNSTQLLNQNIFLCIKHIESLTIVDFTNRSLTGQENIIFNTQPFPFFVFSLPVFY